MNDAFNTANHYPFPADNWAEERAKPLRGVLSDFGHVSGQLRHNSDFDSVYNDRK